ncbi:MAG: integrase/recombinase XerD [Candidatus Sumerlaeota bacterium]|nr:integrase/recombinase XerD [Candidatus Sumerlaeota bacterium]
MASGPDLHHAIESYATWLRVERNLAPRTRKAYGYDLTRFQDWLKETQAKDRIPLRSITAGHLHAYLTTMKDTQGCQAATLGRIVASLRGFFRYCIEEKWLEEDPACDLHRPRLPKKLPVYLIRDELRRLFEAPDRSTAAGRRDFAILVTLAYCGLRLQELVRLDIADLDFARDTIRVFGKGRKERLVPLNASAKEAIVAMLQDEERVVADGERAVFLNAKGRRLTGRAIQYFVDKYVAAAGISRDGVSPHKLRHTFATLLYGSQIELVDIQALMGHASLASTQIYTHTDAGRLQGAINRLEIPD